VVCAGRFEHDDRGAAGCPSNKLGQSGGIIRKLPVIASQGAIRIKHNLGNIDANCILHGMSPTSSCHVGAKPRYPFRFEDRAGATIFGSGPLLPRGYDPSPATTQICVIRAVAPIMQRELPMACASFVDAGLR